MENVESGNKDREIRFKSLKIRKKNLPRDKQDIFDVAIIRRREELWKEGIRNVPIEEREEILERVKSGEITAEDVKKARSSTERKGPSRRGNVTPEQLEESRKKWFPTFIEMSEPPDPD